VEVSATTGATCRRRTEVGSGSGRVGSGWIGVDRTPTVPCTTSLASTILLENETHTVVF
jgi:hypothetical protein